MGLTPVYRHEDKYLISRIQYARLKNLVSALMRRDAHCPEEGYEIRSLYFDAPSNRDFFEKADGVDVRRKLRLRVYGGDAKFAKFEIKRRRDGGIYKQTLSLTRPEAEKLLSPRADAEFLLEKGEAAGDFYRLLKAEGYTPKVIIAYMREAYTLPFYQTRVTFDRGICAGGAPERLFDRELCLTPVVPSSEIVLEVKYNHMFPAFLRPLTASCEGQQMSISKYYQARDTLGL